MHQLKFDQSRKTLTFRNIHKSTRKAPKPLVNSTNNSRAVIDRIHEERALQRQLNSFDYE